MFEQGKQLQFFEDPVLAYLFQDVFSFLHVHAHLLDGIHFFVNLVGGSVDLAEAALAYFLSVLEQI